MRRIFTQSIIFLTLVLSALLNISHAKEWSVDTENSSVRFIYSLEGAAFRGRFRSFSADIDFDPSNPEDGSINGVIQGMNVTGTGVGVGAGVGVDVGVGAAIKYTITIYFISFY